MKSTTFEEIAERRYRRELDSHMKPLLEIMEDERINDLAVNDDGAVYAQLRDGTKERIDIEIEPERIVTIGTLLAAKEDVDLNNNNPSISTKYPDPPLRVSITLSSATRARPVISVRRPSPQVFPLDDFVKKGICTAEEAEKLRRLVRERKNIIVSGETGSGKTTLINSLLLEIPPSDRLFIIQDVEEIQCLAPNKVQVLCSEGHYTQRMAVKDALRFNPDRLIVGAVRDGAALDLIQAWNTGHPGGLCSIHANSASAVKLRLKALVEQVSAMPQKDLIDETVDAVVQITFLDGKRRITEIEVYSDKQPLTN